MMSTMFVLGAPPEPVVGVRDLRVAILDALRSAGSLPAASVLAPAINKIDHTIDPNTRNQQNE